MAKLRACGGKKKKTILRLQIVMEKLQKGFLLGKKMAARRDETEDVEPDVPDTNHVPEDVKEGHLAVVASDEDGDLIKRFIVPLGFLSHPSFLMLLEQAAEEYGFDHQGALMVPCHPRELEKMLKDQNPREGSGSNHVIVGWVCSKTLVKTC